MDEIVIRAIAKWPNVPSVHGWLSLDRRGAWRLRGEPIPNRAVREFIGRNYDRDERGCWYFQNGPQRVYVTLEYTPWILALDGAGYLRTHTGRALERIEGAWLDDAGGLLLAGADGVGAVDDRDLATLADAIVDAAGAPADDARLERALAARDAGGLALAWEGRRISLGWIAARDVARRFRFDPDPRPDA